MSVTPASTTQNGGKIRELIFLAHFFHMSPSKCHPELKTFPDSFQAYGDIFCFLPHIETEFGKSHSRMSSKKISDIYENSMVSIFSPNLNKILFHNHFSPERILKRIFFHLNEKYVKFCPNPYFFLDIDSKVQKIVLHKDI